MTSSGRRSPGSAGLRVNRARRSRSTSRHGSSASSCEQVGARLDAAVEVGQRELLVGAVEVVVVLAPAQEQGIDARCCLSRPTTGIEPPSRMKTGLGAEARLDGPDRGAEAGGVDVDQHGRRPVVRDDLDGHARRADRPRRARGRARRSVLGSWSGTRRKLSFAPALQGRTVLGPGPGVAAVEAVDVAGRPGPLPLERGVARLARQGRHGQVGLELGLRERQLGELGTLPVLQRLDGVVEPGDLDPAVGPLQAGQDRRQGIERVGDRAAVGAGMEVAVGPLDEELEVGQPLQAVGDRRHAGGELAGVGDDRVVAGQPLVVLGDVRLEVGPADLLLALDQELDVHRQRAGRLEPGLGGLQVGEHLPLVVGGPPGVEVAVADGRLERRREPGLQRLGGLDVVVAVDQDRRLARGAAATRRRRSDAAWSRSARPSAPCAARSSRTNSAARSVSAS